MPKVSPGHLGRLLTRDWPAATLYVFRASLMSCCVILLMIRTEKNILILSNFWPSGCTRRHTPQAMSEVSASCGSSSAGGLSTPQSSFAPSYADLRLSRKMIPSLSFAPMIALAPVDCARDQQVIEGEKGCDVCQGHLRGTSCRSQRRFVSLWELLYHFRPSCRHPSVATKSTRSDHCFLSIRP